MKLFFVLAVAASTSMLLVQGAPPGQITSEEMGKVVDQLKEMIKSEAAKLASHPQGQGYGRPGAQKFTSIQKDRVTAQFFGIQIHNCGTAGDIINSALSVLNFYSAEQFGVLVNCLFLPTLRNIHVVVAALDVPAEGANLIIYDLGNGQTCVEVYTEPTTCRGIVAVTIPIPLQNGQQMSIEILVDPVIPYFNQQACITVRVDAPRC